MSISKNFGARNIIRSERVGSFKLASKDSRKINIKCQENDGINVSREIARVYKFEYPRRFILQQ